MSIGPLKRMFRGKKKSHDRLRIFLQRDKVFSSEEASQFRFFQFNSGNAKFFLEQCGQQEIRLAQSPHYRIAQAAVSSDRKEVEAAKDQYLDYLRSSWPAYGLTATPSSLEAKYDQFISLVEKTREEGKALGTIVLTRIPGLPGFFVVDGNHRCSIASSLGLPVSAKVVDFPTVFDRFMRVNEFYGTNNKNLPYQSIYINKTVVRPGRRDDIYDRLGLLAPELICEKTVLDVGCNLGMNAIGAYKTGAKKVVGLEVSERIMNFATRFAVLDQCYPHVEFRQFNVDTDCLPEGEQYDIAFMLSVHHHLKDPGALARIARDHVRKAVVFEGHPDTDLSDYTGFLEAANFARIEKVADLATSVFNSKLSRPLWVLTK